MRLSLYPMWMPWCGDCGACTVVCVYAKRVRGCDGDGNAGVGYGGGVVAKIAACEYMGGTRGSGFVSTADDMLEMSEVRGVRGVCGVRTRCMAGAAPHKSG